MTNLEIEKQKATRAKKDQIKEMNSKVSIAMGILGKKAEAARKEGNAELADELLAKQKELLNLTGALYDAYISSLGIAPLKKQVDALKVITADARKTVKAIEAAKAALKDAIKFIKLVKSFAALAA